MLSKEGGATYASTDEIKAGIDATQTQPLQFAIWAHYMGYGCCSLCITMGIFAILWDDSTLYSCRIDGNDIFAGYVANSTGECYGGMYLENGVTKYACCNPNASDTVSAAAFR